MLYMHKLSTGLGMHVHVYVCKQFPKLGTPTSIAVIVSLSWPLFCQLMHTDTSCCGNTFLAYNQTTWHYIHSELWTNLQVDSTWTVQKYCKYTNYYRCGETKHDIIFSYMLLYSLSDEFEPWSKSVETVLATLAALRAGAISCSS